MTVRISPPERGGLARRHRRAARERLPYMLEHAAVLGQLESHRPDEATVRLSLTDNVFLRSYNWACS
jgi:hypothetical protein